jgi:hypothetical protein
VPGRIGEFRYPSILRHPTVRLTAAWTPERDFNARQCFEDHGFRVQTSQDGLTCDRAMCQNIWHLNSSVRCN